MPESYIHHAEGPAGAPLLLILHGTGGDERQLLPLARELAPGMRLVAPRGDVSEMGAARFFRRRAEGVYDMADLARATARMTAFVEAEIAAAQPSRVLGLGYSNGANLLASLIFARPSLFAAAVLMHPLIPWTPDPVPVATRLLITAGERDRVAPADATAALARWFADQGAPVETVWHQGGHEVGQAEIAAIGRFLRAAAAAAPAP